METQTAEIPATKPSEQNAREAWEEHYGKQGQDIDKLPFDERSTIKTAIESGIVPGEKKEDRRNKMKERLRKGVKAIRENIGHGALSVTALGSMVGPGIHNVEPPPQPYVNIPSLSQTKDTGPEIPQAPTDTWTFASNKDSTFSFTKDPPLKPTEVIKQIQENRKNVNHDRVVRIWTSQGHRVYYGTGIVADDGYVLTAGHVVSHFEEGDVSRSLVFGDGTSVELDIVVVDKERDIALLKYKTDEDRFEPIKIGTYQDGIPLMLMTLDPLDSSYKEGKKTQKTLSGRGDDNYQFQTANRLYGPDYARLQERIRKRNYDIDVVHQKINVLWETRNPSILKRFKPARPYVKKQLPSDTLPYYEHDSKVNVPSGKGGVIKIFIPATSKNITIPGMSGSAYFDKEGRLVGIWGPPFLPEGPGMGEGRGGGIGGREEIVPKQIAAELKRLESQIDLLRGIRNDLFAQAEEAAGKIYDAAQSLHKALPENPMFVPSQEIVPFLKSAAKK